MIGTIVAMLNKVAKGKLAEGVDGEAELYRNISGSGNDSHVTQVLYGGGPPLTNSGGVPWTAAYIDTIDDECRYRLCGITVAPMMPIAM